MWWAARLEGWQVTRLSESCQHTLQLYGSSDVDPVHTKSIHRLRRKRVPHRKSAPGRTTVGENVIVLNKGLTGTTILSAIAFARKALTMRHLTVYNRFALIIAVLSVVFVAALTAQVIILRDTVIEERRTKVFDLVEAAKKILSSYEEKAKAGKISAEEARQLAFDAIGAMRWGKSADYLGV